MLMGGDGRDGRCVCACTFVDVVVRVVVFCRCMSVTSCHLMSCGHASQVSSLPNALPAPLAVGSEPRNPGLSNYCRT